MSKRGRPIKKKLEVRAVEIPVFTPSMTTGQETAKARHYRCWTCDYETTINEASGVVHRCPKCFDLWVARFVPVLSEVLPPPEPPAPKPPKDRLKGEKRYAKVSHEPLNPRFRFIKFEDDGSEGKLWVHVNTPSLRHVDLIVEPNPDDAVGGWVIVKEAPRTL